MAQVEHQGQNKNGGGDGKFNLTHTQCGEEFTFKLKRNRVKVEPSDWRDKLTATEKLQIFRDILADYRIRSAGDGGYKLAAIGITESGDIYIATNTERLSSPYFRQCAEMNMVTAVTQSDMYEQLRAGVVNPHEPKLTALYLMGGRDGEAKRPLCPCGNCTDMLSHVMQPDAPVYLLPVKEKEGEPVNDTARNITEVEPGTIWKTSIGALNVHREINLPKNRADMQRKGFSTMLKRGAKLPEEEGQALADRLTHGAKLHSITDLVTYMLDPSHLATMPAELMHEAEHAVKLMLKSAENALLQKQSVAALDAATENGTPHLADLNRFMVKEIQDCFADRLKEAKLTDDKDSIEQLVEKKVGVIRCVVLQLDDGTYRYAIESRGAFDNAAPSAEMSALAGATKALGTRGVRDAWVMEMAPRDIAKGVMHTSSKEGAERLVKRRSRAHGDVNFHFLPFNPGKATDDQEVAKTMTNLSAIQIFPSYFVGVKQSAAMG